MTAQPAGAAAARRAGVRVHLYGSAGHNLGDDAIAVAASHVIAGVAPAARLSVASVAGAGFGERYGLDTISVDRSNPLGMLRLIASLRRADVVLLGGGTLIQDKLGLSRLRGMLAYVDQLSAIARALGKPLGTVPIGVDELGTHLGRRYAARALARLDLLVVRDQRSLELAKEYAGAQAPPALVAADPAYLLPDREASSEDVASAESRRPYAVLSLVNEDLEFESALDRLAGAARKLLAGGAVARLVLAAMDRRASEERAIFARLLERHPDLHAVTDVEVPHDAFEASRLIGQAAVVVAMRLHAMIFALGRVPLFGISRTTKTSTFLTDAQVRHAAFDSLPGPDELHSQIEQVMRDERALARQARFRALQEGSAREGLELVVECLPLRDRAERGSP